MKRLITIILITTLIGVAGYIVGAMFKSFNPREWTAVGQMVYTFMLMCGIPLGAILYNEIEED